LCAVGYSFVVISYVTHYGLPAAVVMH